MVFTLDETSLGSASCTGRKSSYRSGDTKKYLIFIYIKTYLDKVEHIPRTGCRTAALLALATLAPTSHRNFSTMRFQSFLPRTGCRTAGLLARAVRCPTCASAPPAARAPARISPAAPAGHDISLLNPVDLSAVVSEDQVGHARAPAGRAPAPTSLAAPAHAAGGQHNALTALRLHSSREQADVSHVSRPCSGADIASSSLANPKP